MGATIIKARGKAKIRTGHVLGEKLNESPALLLAEALASSIDLMAQMLKIRGKTGGEAGKHRAEITISIASEYFNA